MAKPPNYIRFHMGDYLRDCMELSLCQHGAYLSLMLWYYSTGKPLPNQPDRIYRRTQATSAEERFAVDFVLTEFFVLDGPVWRHKRIDEELAAWEERSGAASKSADSSWKKRRNKNNSHADANALESHSHGNANQNQSNTKSNTPGPDGPAGLDDRLDDAAIALGKADPAKVAWQSGVSLLKSQGSSEASARSYLGKLVKVHGQDAVTLAIEAALTVNPVDAKGFLIGAIARGAGNGKSKHQSGKFDPVEYVLANSRVPRDQLIGE